MALVAGETGDCHPCAEGTVVNVRVVQDPVGCLGEHDAARIPRDRCLGDIGGLVAGHGVGHCRTGRTELQACNSLCSDAARILRKDSGCVRSRFLDPCILLSTADAGA